MIISQIFQKWIKGFVLWEWLVKHRLKWTWLPWFRCGKKPPVFLVTASASCSLRWVTLCDPRGWMTCSNTTGSRGSFFAVDLGYRWGYRYRHIVLERPLPNPAFYWSVTVARGENERMVWRAGAHEDFFDGCASQVAVGRNDSRKGMSAEDIWAVRWNKNDALCYNGWCRS